MTLFQYISPNENIKILLNDLNNNCLEKCGSYFFGDKEECKKKCVIYEPRESLLDMSRTYDDFEDSGDASEKESVVANNLFEKVKNTLRELTGLPKYTGIKALLDEMLLYNGNNVRMENFLKFLNKKFYLFMRLMSTHNSSIYRKFRFLGTEEAILDRKVNVIRAFFISENRTGGKRKYKSKKYRKFSRLTKRR